MTNYQKIINEMDFDKLVWMMSLHCEECPHKDCPHRRDVREYIDCECELTKWLNKEVEVSE